MYPNVVNCEINSDNIEEIYKAIEVIHESIEQKKSLLITNIDSKYIVRALGYILTADCRYSQDIIQLLGMYILNETAIKKIGAKKKSVINDINKVMFMHQVHVYKYYDNYCWNKMDDLINRKFNLKYTKGTVRREYQKFKKENLELVAQWDKNPGQIIGEEIDEL